MTAGLAHWHTHNRFELLVDSHEFFPSMLAAIRNANRTIYFEQYLVASGSVLNDFIQALLAAAASGVEIYLLFDDYGAKRISTYDRNRLLAAGMHLKFYNLFRWSQLYSSMRRNHRKLLLIDDQIAFVGGACINDEYRIEDPPSRSWHDTVVRIEGQVVDDWRKSFVGVWREVTGESLPVPSSSHTVTEHEPGRIALANGRGNNQILRHAIAQIKKSRNIIWIATPYFVITLKMRHALKRAARHGVDVRLLLPGDITDHPWITQAARRYYARLLKNKVKIYEYQPRFIHAKLIICDTWVSIGSSNLDRWNHFWNLDANQEIWHSEFADQVRALFKRDFAQSHCIDAEEWKQRPWQQRLQEWRSSYRLRVIQWLTYIATRIRKKAD